MDDNLALLQCHNSKYMVKGFKQLTLSYPCEKVSQLYVHVSFCLKVIRSWHNLPTGGHGHVIYMCMVVNLTITAIHINISVLFLVSTVFRIIIIKHVGWRVTFTSRSVDIVAVITAMIVWIINIRTIDSTRRAGFIISWPLETVIKPVTLYMLHISILNSCWSTRIIWKYTNKCSWNLVSIYIGYRLMCGSQGARWSRDSRLLELIFTLRSQYWLINKTCTCLQIIIILIKMYYVGIVIIW